MHALKQTVKLSYRALTSICLFGFSLLWFTQGPKPATLVIGFTGFGLLLVAAVYDQLT